MSIPTFSIDFGAPVYFEETNKIMISEAIEDLISLLERDPIDVSSVTKIMDVIAVSIKNTAESDAPPAIVISVARALLDIFSKIQRGINTPDYFRDNISTLRGIVANLTYGFDSEFGFRKRRTRKSPKRSRKAKKSVKRSKKARKSPKRSKKVKKSVKRSKKAKKRSTKRR